MKSKINYTIKTLVTLLLLLFYVSEYSFAQKRKSNILKNDSNIAIPVVFMPEVNNDSLAKYYDNQSKNANYVIAKYFDITIKTTTNGIWIKNSDSTFSWLCKIKSKNAFSLNFIIEKMNLTKDSKLYFINPISQTIVGPFEQKNSNLDSTLYIEPIPGDEIIIELDIPLFTKTNNHLFTISKIGHDFRDFYKINSNTRGKSGKCEHDVNCGMGLNWQKEKRSIVKYTFPENGGLSSCTGTLINNTANNETPYIITANHCIKDANTASLATFYFNYENSNCNYSDAVLTHSINGSQLIATSKDSTVDLDFTLLKLKIAVPSSFSPYYSGWSLKKNVESKVVTLHHPQGDPTKISYDNNAIVNGNFTDNGYMGNSHWQILKWDTGATEKGSSGCPLYNQNHQIIGTLTGGDATCGNAINDFFAKFYKSWNYFSDSIYQLKHWLDPINLDVTELSGYDPSTANRGTITNVEYNEELVTYLFGDSTNGGWTGYNEPKMTKLAEKFSGIKNKYLYAIKFPIQMFTSNADISKITLKIWTGFDKPDSEIFSHTLVIDSLNSKKYYCLRLKNRIFVGSNFFVGFDISKLNNTDSIFLFTCKNRSSKSSSLRFFYQSKWINASNLGLFTSLGIEAYVIDSISFIKTISRIPEQLNTIHFNTKSMLRTRELFGIDSIENANEKDWLQLHYMTDNKGFWTGTNSCDITKYKEIYSTNESKYISSLKIAIAKNTVSNQNSKILLTINNNTKPLDSAIYSQEINTNKLKANYYNIITFSKPILVDSIFNIELNTENIDKLDTFAIYMGNPKTTKNLKHSFYNANSNWVNYNLFSMPENLCLSSKTWYSPYVYDRDSVDYEYPIINKIKEANVVLKKFILYPNPSSIENNQIMLNFGYDHVTNASIFVYDMLGRIISMPTPLLNDLNSVVISTKDLSPGIYYVKVIIDKETFSPVPMIIVR